MDEKELKTSVTQRVIIIIIAILMVGSIIASYAAIVISGSQGSSSDQTPKVDEAKVAAAQEALDVKTEELKKVSEKDFKKFVSYKSDVIKAYNETSANENGVQTHDLETGSGAEVKDDNYLAYYIGWCADETVFDSSLDDASSPTSFKSVLDPSMGLIEGWTKGVEGMKIGGIREVTIPSNQAYKDSDVACGANKPLKFVIMAIPREGVPAEFVEAQMKLQYAYYGIDLEEVPAEE